MTRFRTFSGGHALSSVSMLYFLLLLASNGDFFLGEELLSYLGGDAAHGFTLSVDGGAQQICERLANKIGKTASSATGKDCSPAILLGSAVESVVDEAEATLVTSSDASTGLRRRWRCRRVVCAVPPQALATVRFEPPLPPSVRYVVQGMTSGDVTKFVVQFERAFWRESGFSGRIAYMGGKQVNTASCMLQYI